MEIQQSHGSYVYKTAGACPIRADVYLPATSQSAPPVVVYIHGGALISGSRHEVQGQHLSRYLAAGWAVVAFDYRLAPQAKLPDILSDLDDAFAWLAAKQGELVLDARRLTIVGHSAGGFLTLSMGVRLRPRPRALVAFYGYGDIGAPWYAQPDPFYCSQPAVAAETAWQAVGNEVVSNPRGDRWPFYLYCRQHGIWPREVAGLDPHSQRDALLAFCPQYHVDGQYPPTLLLHGDADTDVPCQQSRDMADALASANVPHELMILPGAPHGFDCDKDSPAAKAGVDKAMEFLKRHLS